MNRQSPAVMRTWQVLSANEFHYRNRCVALERFSVQHCNISYINPRTGAITCADVFVNVYTDLHQVASGFGCQLHWPCVSICRFCRARGTLGSGDIFLAVHTIHTRQLVRAAQDVDLFLNLDADTR